MTARIVPSDGDPGAVEANCVGFIDQLLAIDPVERALYAAALPSLAAVTAQRSGKPFVELSAAEQDEILAALESGAAEGWPQGAITSQRFFAAVRLHTVYGFLADPRHGGNRDFLGWRTAGYPGSGHARGGYDADQMTGERAVEPVWEKSIRRD